MRVADGFRGRGLGAQVLSWAIDRTRDRGGGFLQLVTDKRWHDGHRFYARWGFTPSHENLKLWLGD